MSSASRSALITSCSVSLSLPTTRSWSPWMRTCTLGLTFWIRLRRSRAMSSVMPALSWTSIWPRPLPMVLGSPALNSFGDSCRRAAFSRSTCRAARARSSLADSITMTPSRRSYAVCVSLKSNRVLTSRRAWSSALVSSEESNSDTTSNENSAIALGEDRVEAHGERDDREHHADDGADRQQRADAGAAFVERLHRRPVVRVRPVVQVVETGGTRLVHELVEHGRAAGRQRLRLQVGNGGLEVVARPAELGDDQVERVPGGGSRVLAAQVRDQVVQRHSGSIITEDGRTVQVVRPGLHF